MNETLAFVLIFVGTVWFLEVTVGERARCAWRRTALHKRLSDRFRRTFGGVVLDNNQTTWVLGRFSVRIAHARWWRASAATHVRVWSFLLRAWTLDKFLRAKRVLVRFLEGE